MTVAFTCPDCGGAVDLVRGGPNLNGSLVYTTYPCRHRVGEHEATRLGVTLWQEPVNASTLVALERRRQITEEGYTLAHDAEMNRKNPGYLGLMLLGLADRAMSTNDRDLLDTPSLAWPVEKSRWPRGKTPTRMLVHAGAILHGEIDLRISSGQPL